MFQNSSMALTNVRLQLQLQLSAAIFAPGSAAAEASLRAELSMPMLSVCLLVWGRCRSLHKATSLSSPLTPAAGRAEPYTSSFSNKMCSMGKAAGPAREREEGGAGVD